MDPLKGQAAATPSPGTVYTKQQRIAKLAREAPEMAFTTLAHHIDLAWLTEAHRRTRKDGAVGIDGRSAADYARDLESNLGSLLERAKSGSYKAPPVRRVHIPKGDGSQTRPIGIPTFEDKILQRAIAMVLESIYEEDFCSCSYGFRPNRSCHDALNAVWQSTMRLSGGWVLELDISKFFDNLDHDHLREILRQRVRDGVVLRLIGKWLKAGVLESGRISRTTLGSPQGGVISPLLANIYLHEVLDTWFGEMVRPCMHGRCDLIRYADDAVMVFEDERDAHRVLKVLPKRFAKYGLTLHPEKTRLVRFEIPERRRDDDPDDKDPGSFDFLGFTHHWAKSRKGNWVVKRKTAKDRITRTLRSLSDWCRKHRHMPIAKQCEMLGRKLRGHYGYYGITGNSRSLRNLVHAVERIWHKWLGRRNSHGIPWLRFQQLKSYHRLPLPILVHPSGIT